MIVVIMFYMKKTLHLNLHNLNIPVEVTYGTRNRRTFYLCYGIISTTISENSSLSSLRERLEKIFPYEKLAKINLTPLYTDSYVYIFGSVYHFINRGKSSFDYEHCYVNLGNGFLSIKEILYSYIVNRLEELEKIMGLSRHQIKIRNMVTCLGVNHLRSHEITFGIKLVHFSKELIDSVIIHELCHDKVANHSQKFYNLVEQYCQNYKEKTQKLIYGKVN